MAFIQASFFSSVLIKQVALYAIVPEGKPGPFPVLYLLHGLSDDHTIWHRRTRIEWYVRDLPLIVVMPDGFRSFYTDHSGGPAFGRYMLEDVIGFSERTFPALKDRAGRCIGGLSMGGYGAMRLALENPGIFVSANSHSGSGYPWKRDDPEFKRMFGTGAEGSAHDLEALAGKLKRCRKPAPQILMDCGTEDFLLQENRGIHAGFEKLKLPHEYREFPGAHDWDYWDLHIQEALKFHCQALGIGDGKR